MKWKQRNTFVKGNENDLVGFIHENSAPVEVVTDGLRMPQWCTGLSHFLLPEKTEDDDERRRKTISDLTLLSICYFFLFFVILIFSNYRTYPELRLTQVWRLRSSSLLM